MQVVRLVEHWRGVLLDLSVERPGDPVLVRCIRGHIAVDARDRMLILAGQAFIAIVPLLIVSATIASSVDGDAIASYFISRFSLTGETADTMRDLFRRPPGATSGVGLLSVVILLFSINSFSRSVRKTVERAWRLPPTGFRGALAGVAGVLTLVAMLALVSWLGLESADLGALRVGVVALQIVVSLAGWVVVMHLLLTKRVPFAALWPGAVYGTVAQVAASWASNLYLPGLLARNADRYGVIGVSFALVWWLVILAALLVSVSVVSAELGRDRLAAGPPVALNGSVDCVELAVEDLL